MAYTSEQYKYLLLKRLQRHFSFSSATARNYTYTFFGKLFDESVTVTEESYNTFVELMDDELQYCADNDIYYGEDIPKEDVESHSLLLIDAFAAIGITLEIDTGSGIGTFTKPNGEVMTYSYTDFYINAKASTEYEYAKLSAPYYNMRDMEVLELSDLDIQVCGIGCYWRYDAETATMTISGDGSYYAATTAEEIGSGAYNTLILGANVSHLAASSLATTSLTTVVFLHAADFPLVIDENATNTKNGYSLEIYTDNEVVLNHEWGENASITWHSLEEWEE